jgi:hypothetical protein
MILLLVSALGAAQAAAAAAPEPAPSAEAKAFEQRCGGRQFETSIAREVNGKKRLSRIHLCGDAGQTNAQWISTLKDAIAKIEAAPGFSADSKTQAIEAIKDEIAKAGGKVETALSRDIAAASTDSDFPAAPVEYSTLPPLPGPRPVIAANPAPPIEYTKLPPLPAPKVAGTASVAASLPVLAKPQLKIQCFNPAEFASPAECDSLERETVLTIRADEQIPSGTALRFLRRGDTRAEIELTQLGRGKSEKFALPREVCAGVVESRVEIQIIRRSAAQSNGQVVDTLGPYFLRC